MHGVASLFSRRRRDRAQLTYLSYLSLRREVKRVAEREGKRSGGTGRRRRSSLKLVTEPCNTKLETGPIPQVRLTIVCNVNKIDNTWTWEHRNIGESVDTLGDCLARSMILLSSRNERWHSGERHTRNHNLGLTIWASVNSEDETRMSQGENWLSVIVVQSAERVKSRLDGHGF